MMEYWKVADCEIARASYMLSVALFIQNSSDPEALVWREKAERVRREMQGETYLAECENQRANRLSHNESKRFSSFGTTC